MSYVEDLISVGVQLLLLQCSSWVPYEWSIPEDFIKKLSHHSKIDKTKILMTNGNLTKVKSVAECSLGAFCNTFDLIVINRFTWADQ